MTDAREDADAACAGSARAPVPVVALPGVCWVKSPSVTLYYNQGLGLSGPTNCELPVSEIIH